MLKSRGPLIKNPILFSVLLFTFLACGPKPSSYAAHTQSPTLQSIINRDTIRVGTTGDFMPFSYIMDSIVGYSGIDIAMANDLAKTLGVQLKFIETTWPTLMSDLEKGKFDIGMSGITITPERKTQAFFSTSVYPSGKVAITRDENVSLYGSIEDINKKEVRVIFNPGGTNESFARANFPKATLILNEDNLSIFQKIVDQHADVMVTDAIETMIQERIHKELDAVNLQKPFNAFDFGYLIPKDSVFKKRIDQWLMMRKNDRMVIKLLQKEIEKLD